MKAPYLLFMLCFEFGYLQTDFCKSTCNLKINNCCRYRTVASSCKTSITIITTSNETKRNFIGKLNYIRNTVAGGEHPRSELKNVKAANMHVISYSSELEYSAHCWATQCTLHLSRCKAVEGGLVAETIYHRAIKSKEHIDATLLLGSIDDFFYQAQDKINISQYEEQNLPLKEILRGTAQYVGCSTVTFTTYGIRVGLTVCHYFPVLYKPGATVFDVGKPCSKCIKGERCGNPLVYKNLCGRVRALIEDPWYPLHPPISLDSGTLFVSTSITVMLLLYITYCV